VPRHRGLKITIAVLALLFAGAAALVADAYYQAFKIAGPVQSSRGDLGVARRALLRGKLPRGDRFGAASAAASDAQTALARTNLAFRLVRNVPLVNRPLRDVELGVEAAGEWAQAATIGRDIVTDVFGVEIAPSRGKGAKHGRAPAFHAGTADLRLIRSLRPRFEALLAHVQAADRAVGRIEALPFYRPMTDEKTKAEDELAHDAGVIRSGLVLTRLLPAFFGGDKAKTYLLALQQASRQRATGGVVTSFGLLKADGGRISLQSGSSIAAHEPPGGFAGVALPSAVDWYVRNVPGQAPRIDTVNLTPDFPADARAWAALLARGAHRSVDGVIAFDAQAISGMLGRSRIHVPSYPSPLSRSNVVQVVENAQFSLSSEARKAAFSNDLLRAAFGLFADPHPLAVGIQALGGELGQRHVQVWMADRHLQDLVRQVGWDGAVAPGNGDFLSTAENSLGANQVDYFTHTTLSYRLVIDGSGNGRATATARIDNQTPKSEPQPVVGTVSPYALNDVALGLYVPRRARLVRQSPGSGYPEHVEGEARVLTRHVKASPGRPGIATFTYSIPGVVQQTADGRLYRLAVRHQPSVNAQTVDLSVTLPVGASATSARGWTVNGNVATFHGILTRDLTLEIRY
jgi:hypothetical protein